MAYRKYRNQPVTIDGHRFPSKLEAKRFGELKLLERAGEISGLELQPKFPFVIGGRPVLIRSKGYPNGRRASFKADFAYFDHKNNCRVVEDTKGMRTESYALRRAIVEALYPGVKVTEVRA